MVVKSYRPILNILAELWLPLIPILAYLLAVSWLDIRYHLEDYNFPSAIAAIPGTAIALLLAFRTKSSYGRWWEARTLWGAIVNDSRSWTRQLLAFTRDDENSEAHKTIHRMALRQIAWCYSLSRNLRQQDPVCDLDTFIDESELESYQTSHHVPNDLLLRQARDLKTLYDDNRLELFQFVELERTMVRLTNSMGGCERIKNTTFPTSYSKMVTGLIYVFVFFLPFSLVNVPAAGLVGTSVALALAFLAIERVSFYLQDPFNNHPSDTPMLAISRVIEINIKQMLGEQDLPEKLEPVDGVLY